MSAHGSTKQVRPVRVSSAGTRETRRPCSPAATRHDSFPPLPTASIDVSSRSASGLTLRVGATQGPEALVLTHYFRTQSGATQGAWMICRRRGQAPYGSRVWTSGGVSKVPDAAPPVTFKPFPNPVGGTGRTGGVRSSTKRGEAPSCLLPSTSELRRRPPSLTWTGPVSACAAVRPDFSRQDPAVEVFRCRAFR